MQEGAAKEALRKAKRSLIKVHDDIEATTTLIEGDFATEYNRSISVEYGLLCRTLGVLEEEIAEISNQLTKMR